MAVENRGKLAPGEVVLYYHRIFDGYDRKMVRQDVKFFKSIGVPARTDARVALAHKGRTPYRYTAVIAPESSLTKPDNS